MFTGGIGEHSDRLRSLVCARLAWLGVGADETDDAARVRTLVVPSREDRQMYAETLALLGSG